MAGGNIPSFENRKNQLSLLTHFSQDFTKLSKNEIVWKEFGNFVYLRELLLLKLIISENALIIRCFLFYPFFSVFPGCWGSVSMERR